MLNKGLVDRIINSPLEDKEAAIFHALKALDAEGKAKVKDLDTRLLLLRLRDEVEAAINRRALYKSAFKDTQDKLLEIAKGNYR